TNKVPRDFLIVFEIVDVLALSGKGVGRRLVNRDDVLVHLLHFVEHLVGNEKHEGQKQSADAKKYTECCHPRLRILPCTNWPTLPAIVNARSTPVDIVGHYTALLGLATVNSMK